MQSTASDLGMVPHWSMHQRMMSCGGRADGLEELIRSGICRP